MLLIYFQKNEEIFPNSKNIEINEEKIVKKDEF